ncbi:helix-turn-helix domain-containing protein [Amycolatopsis nigrescens]|uniref:helix-turn-helix domain-containing protein n=1 Tax=Amycolatopsis nigrescens TaxID=381445 RepID=UPI0003713022|nr:helix-turn-helix transcriptional regulator [Amycolatopsis nigrescens]
MIVDPELGVRNGPEFVALMTELVRLRRLRGVSQRDVAEKMGVHAATVCRMEQGARLEVRVAQVQAYAQALGLRVAMILTPAD